MDVLTTLANLSMLVFVICSMLSMGLSLTVAELTVPLKNTSLVIKSLIASFVLVPILGYALATFMPVTEGAAIGIIIVACAAGAPFLPKLVQVAKGDIAFGVGLMTLLMVLTVIYMPVVLPLLLQGVEVDALAIATSLFFQRQYPTDLCPGLEYRPHCVDGTESDFRLRVLRRRVRFLVDSCFDLVHHRRLCYRLFAGWAGYGHAFRGLAGHGAAQPGRGDDRCRGQLHRS